jgi:ClpP class serine protease
LNLKKITNLNDIEKSEQYKIRKKEYNRQSYLKRKQNKENNNDIAIVQLNENIENKDKNRTQVNHKNKIRDDNKIQNLEWVTPSENNIHAKSKILNL